MSQSETGVKCTKSSKIYKQRENKRQMGVKKDPWILQWAPLQLIRVLWVQPQPQLNRNDNPLPPLWHLGLSCTHTLATATTTTKKASYLASSLGPQRLAKPKPKPTSSAPSIPPITSWRVALPAPHETKVLHITSWTECERERPTDRP